MRTRIDHAMVVGLLMFWLFWFGYYRLSRIEDDDDE
jgi:hypothetical protein